MNKSKLKIKPIIFVTSKSTSEPSTSTEKSRHDFKLDGKEVRTFYENVVSQEAEATRPRKEDEIVRKRVRTIRKERRITSPNPRKDCTERQLNRLLYHCQHGDLKSFERLLADEPLINLNFRDLYGWTPLMVASHEGHVDIVRHLLSRSEVEVWSRSKDDLNAYGLAKSASIRDLFEPKVKVEPSDRLIEQVEVTDCELCSIENVSNDHHASIVHQFNTSGTGRLCQKHYSLGKDNRGYRMMVRAGWDKNKGLGRYEQGPSYPVKTRLKRDRLGIGSSRQTKERVTHRDVDCNAPRGHVRTTSKDRKSKLSLKEIGRKFRNEFNECE